MKVLSKEEIRMFCTPEIQGPWKPEVGDRTDKGIVIKIVPDGRIILHTSRYTGYIKKDLIFLPSIEQLAEMWLRNYQSLENAQLEQPITPFIYNLNKFTQLRNCIAWPLHIIVLHFFMSDVHGKKWSEKEGWVSSA